MEFEIKFGDAQDPADIEVTLMGAPTPETFVKLNESLTADPRFRTGMKMLVDLSALDASGLSGSDVQGLSETVIERDWYQMPAAVAIIASGEQTYRAALAYRAHLGGSRSNRQVFRTRPEAVAWLEDQRD